MAERRLRPERLEAARVVLEPLRAEDAAELAPLLDDPALHRFIGGEPLTADQLEARYRRLEGGAPAESGQTWLNWAIRRRADGAAVGTGQATVVGADAQLAWVIASPWQGNGYAGEAARAMVRWADDHGLAAVAHVHPAHRASERVATRAGLAPTDERAAQERVWRRAVPEDAGRR